MTFFTIREKDDDTTTLSGRTSGGTLTFYAHKSTNEEIIKRTVDYMMMKNNEWFHSSKLKVNEYLDAAHDVSLLSETIKQNPYLNHPGNHFSLAYKV